MTPQDCSVWFSHLHSFQEAHIEAVFSASTSTTTITECSLTPMHQSLPSKYASLPKLASQLLEKSKCEHEDTFHESHATDSEIQNPITKFTGSHHTKGVTAIAEVKQHQGGNDVIKGGAVAWNSGNKHGGYGHIGKAAVGVHCGKAPGGQCGAGCGGDGRSKCMPKGWVLIED
ncbi:hypothetical protein M422DRAFT_47981 [Sphaerobolus stellatus SS14]|uniref:Uncharacterized protein n=1 Tax=Sphaerobolus stellatus (strain SS14) TaxID=990650 RepID=A0A0C9UJ65_SPHS4|nr:hypothetical protein M422DRAFT_47981 [Sphaerobolus stellatus SS14]